MKWLDRFCTGPGKQAGLSGRGVPGKWLVLLVLIFVSVPTPQVPAQQKLEKVRLTVPAKSLTFIPFYFGKAQGLYAREGIDLEIIVMRPPLGVTALVAGDLDYSAAGGLSIRAAMKGAGIRTVGFIQTRLSFSLIGQPGMVPGKMKNVAVSGIGSLAHYAATLVMKKLNNEKVAYISTNTTASSYTALLSKVVDAAVLSPPYTSMATLAGYPELGNTYDVRDLQGGLVARQEYIRERPERVKSMIRATLRSMDAITKDEPEVIAYLQKDFGQEPKVAADTYKIVRQVVNADGDIENAVLKSIIDKIRQEAGFAGEIPLDRLVDLAILREVKNELKRR
jgi:ABC-type nitrate/sulfonate/bicarbonate transport system substrate-binding protein